jgi:beta-mannosidase
MSSDETIAYEVPANASRCVWRGAVAEARDHILTVRSASGIFPANRLLPVPVKDLALDPDPGLKTIHEAEGGALRITIAADRYALGVALRSDDPSLRFTDNHFDLAGGERHTVTVTHRTGAPVSPEAIAVSVWNRSLSR